MILIRNGQFTIILSLQFLLLAILFRERLLNRRSQFEANEPHQSQHVQIPEAIPVRWLQSVNMIKKHS